MFILNRFIFSEEFLEKLQQNIKDFATTTPSELETQDQVTPSKDTDPDFQPDEDQKVDTPFEPKKPPAVPKKPQPDVQKLDTPLEPTKPPAVPKNPQPALTQPHKRSTSFFASKMSKATKPTQDNSNGDKPTVREWKPIYSYHCYPSLRYDWIELHIHMPSGFTGKKKSYACKVEKNPPKFKCNVPISPNITDPTRHHEFYKDQFGREFHYDSAKEISHREENSWMKGIRAELEVDLPFECKSKINTKYPTALGQKNVTLMNDEIAPGNPESILIVLLQSEHKHQVSDDESEGEDLDSTLFSHAPKKTSGNKQRLAAEALAHMMEHGLSLSDLIDMGTQPSGKQKRNRGRSGHRSVASAPGNPEYAAAAAKGVPVTTRGNLKDPPPYSLKNSNTIQASQHCGGRRCP